MPDMAKPGISINDIDQVGIVVRDLQKAIDYYSSTLGIGPFRILEQYWPNLLVRGKVVPTRTKLAFAQAGRLQIELIQNIEGENIYTEFLRDKGEGLHHVAMCVDDADREIEKWEKNGVKALQKGHAGGVSWAYFDTQAIGGVIFEIIPKPRRKQA